MYTINTIITICKNGYSARHTDAVYASRKLDGLMPMAMDVVKQDIERAYDDVFNDSYKLETIELTTNELSRLNLELPVIRQDLYALEYRACGDEDFEQWKETNNYCTLTLHYAQDIGTLIAIYNPYN